jgi:hypothetical protein
MRHLEPLVATVIENPTNRDLKYTWLGKNGTFVKSKSSITVPYEVYSVATPSQRAQLGAALKAKIVKISFDVRGVKTKDVKSISTYVKHGKQLAAKATPPKNEALEKAEANAKAVKEAREKKAEEAKARTEVIREVGDGKDAIKDSQDIVQKATGQETLSMQEAMGWEKPPTEDTRQSQETETVTMNDALTEEVGDPLEKAAAAAEADKKKKDQDAKLEEATKSPDEKKADEAATAKRKAAAKKAAATRKANAAKKGKNK